MTLAPRTDRRITRGAPWGGRLVALLFLAACGPAAHAQGCAMCLMSAVSQGKQAMEAMNLGILVLLVPSFLMILGVLAFTFLRRS